jgi:NAD(P)H-hydrate epimerase
MYQRLVPITKHNSLPVQAGSLYLRMKNKVDLPQLPPREPDAHKGTFGRALVVGGSRGMTGAISLTGISTLRSGAGLVTLAVPDSVLPIVAAYEPSYMTVGLAEDETAPGHIGAKALAEIKRRAETATCIALGPGIGRTDELTKLVSELYQKLPQPLVVDADALFALAQKKNTLAKPGGPRILTPHPGEFQRLVQREDLTRDEAETLAMQMAAENKIVVVLKGAHTLVTDGKESFHNVTGNPGMATGGSGDVLTGVITALVCQGLKPYEAAQLGVYLHGLAGDLCAADLGQVGMIASDLVKYLPRAFCQSGNSD